MITWIFDKYVDRSKGRSTPLINDAVNRGHIVHCLRDSIIPKSIDLTGITVKGPTIIRGSHGFVNYVESILHPSPGGFLHPSNFQLPVYSPMIGDLCLNSNHSIIEYGDLRNNRYDFPNDIFVKPLNDMKKFNGITLNNGITLEQAYLIKYEKQLQLLDNLKIIVSPVIEIFSEYRIVVVNRTPITGSSYNDDINVPNDIFDTVKQLTQIWNPTDVYVVDIATTKNGNKVVEYNQFSTSALYACDQKLIVEALEKFLN